MKKTTGIGAGIAIIVALIFGLATEGKDITGCSETFPNVTQEIEYSNVADWIDPRVKRFKKLSKAEGAPAFKVVWHHSVTASDLTAGEICGITDDRFAMGCSYVASIHENGKVIQVNDFEEYTASVGNMNSQVISFVFVGNYQENELPDVMLKSACMLKYALEKYDELNDDFEIEGFYLHRDFKNTLCPGDNAVRQLKECGLVDNYNNIQ